MGLYQVGTQTRLPLFTAVPLHRWRLWEAATPMANSGTQSLTISNTGTVGTGVVAPGNRGLIFRGVEVFQGGATDRPVVYSANPASADVVTGKALSVGCWVQFRAANANGYCVQKMYDSNLANWNASYVGAAWELGLNSSGNFIFAVVQGTAGSGTRAAASASYGPALGHWYYLCGVYDGTTLQTVSLYVNGMFAASAAASGNIDNSTTNSNNGGPYSIGGTASTNASGNSLTCSAIIEEVSIVALVITETTIRGRYCAGFSAVSRTIAGYPFR